MTNTKTIQITIPLEVAVELSKFTQTYAPLVKVVAQACFDTLYSNKIVNEE